MRSGGKRRAGLVGAMVLTGGVIVWVETHHTIPAFRAWTFGGLFILAALATALARGAVRNGFLAAATVLVGLCVLEIAAGLMEPKTDVTYTPFWVARTPVVGFGFDRAGVIHARKADRKTGAVIYDAHYTIDAAFNRAVRSPVAQGAAAQGAAADAPATVFFGDSFTFGDGLDDADTLPQRYADRDEGTRVVNLAVSGYSPQQVLRTLETGLRDDVIGPHPKALVFLTSAFHAMRTACKEPWTDRAPRYVRDGEGVAFAGPCFAGAALWWHEFLKNTALYRVAVQPFVVRLTGADVDLYVRIVAAVAAKAKARYGIDMLVPYLRIGPAYLAGAGTSDDVVLAALKARGVDTLDVTLRDDLAKGEIFAIPGDGHATAAANRVRAEMIAAALGRAPAAPVR